MKKKNKTQLVDMVADLMEKNKDLQDELEGFKKAFKECWKRGKYYQIKYEELKGKKK